MKTVKKMIQEVSFDRLAGKKGVFSVKIEVETVLWALKEGENYLCYVLDETKRGTAVKYLQKLKNDEEEMRIAG